MKIQRQSVTPIYLQLRDQVLKNILNGVWLPGKKLPADRELAKSLGVNQITLRKAMNMLQAEGYLTRYPGHGTYVAEPLPSGGNAPVASRNVAVLFDSIDEETFSRTLFVSLFRSLDAAGMTMRLFSANNDPAVQRRQLQEVVQDSGCAGCLIWSILPDSEAREILQGNNARPPVVFLDHCPDFPCDWSGYDDYQAAWHLGQAFASIGFRHAILCLDHDTSHFWSTSQRRLDGFADGLGQPTRRFTCTAMAVSPEEESALLRMLPNGQEPVVLYCSSPNVATTLKQYPLLAMRNNVELCYIQTDPDLDLMSVKMDLAAMGANAVAILKERLQGDRSPQLSREAAFQLDLPRFQKLSQKYQAVQ
ncbi:MAG: GntR family transcriptional regulator [Victivallales bacterium]|nr:GntR family transcriptional regulator [Victivallales bacterium]